MGSSRLRLQPLFVPDLSLKNRFDPEISFSHLFRSGFLFRICPLKNRGFSRFGFLSRFLVPFPGSWFPFPPLIEFMTQKFCFHLFFVPFLFLFFSSKIPFCPRFSKMATRFLFQFPFSLCHFYFDPEILFSPLFCSGFVPFFFLKYPVLSPVSENGNPVFVPVPFLALPFFS